MFLLPGLGTFKAMLFRKSRSIVWNSTFTSQLMLYSEIIAVCSQIHKKHINTLCGQNVELLNVKLAVHIVTTGPFRSAKCALSECTPTATGSSLYFTQPAGRQEGDGASLLATCRPCEITSRNDRPTSARVVHVAPLRRQGVGNPRDAERTQPPNT